jgi:hypothetical protein
MRQSWPSNTKNATGSHSEGADEFLGKENRNLLSGDEGPAPAAAPRLWSLLAYAAVDSLS